MKMYTFESNAFSWIHEGDTGLKSDLLEHRRRAQKTREKHFFFVLRLNIICKLKKAEKVSFVSQAEQSWGQM